MKIQTFNTEKMVYNHIRRSYIRPKQYEENFCPECKGLGEGEFRINRGSYRGTKVCKRCLGKGIVDWVKRPLQN